MKAKNGLYQKKCQAAEKVILGIIRSETIYYRIWQSNSVVFTTEIFTTENDRFSVVGDLKKKGMHLRPTVSLRDTIACSRARQQSWEYD